MKCLFRHGNVSLVCVFSCPTYSETNPVNSYIFTLFFSIFFWIMDSRDYQKLLDKCIYDYFVKKGMHETAEAFANETDVGNPTDDGNKCIYDYFVKNGMSETAEAFASDADVKNPTADAIESPEVCLTEWWDMFYDMFSSNQAAQDPYAEAARTMDNVVPQVPYAVPASSAHSATPAHNISPVVPAFSPERSQEQCYPMTPEDEVTSNLRFLEMDRPIQRSPFVTDPSRLMEQIPYMPQQWDARMEPNADTTTRKAMLPVPDPSEAGSSTGSCFGMKRTP